MVAQLGPASLRLRVLVLQSTDVTHPCLIDYLLQFAAVLNGGAHFWHQLVRDIDRKPPFPPPAVERITAVTLAGSTRWAVRTDAGSLAQRQRADGNRPEIADDLREPAADILGGFSSKHVYVILYMCTRQTASYVPSFAYYCLDA